MKNLKELREERAKLHASAQAIVDVATSDKRELTAEESQQVDRVFGRGKAGEANYAAGELDKIDERNFVVVREGKAARHCQATPRKADGI